MFKNIFIKKIFRSNLYKQYVIKKNYKFKKINITLLYYDDPF
jgi:hypothetical protein